jgi:UPF0755 protein
MENISLSNDSISLEKQPPKQKSLLKRFILALITLFIMFLLAQYLFLSAPSSFKENVIFNIKEDTNLRQLSFQLKKENIIRSRAAFEAFAIVYEGEKHIIPGDYLFEKKIPVYEIAHRVSKGQYHLGPIKVTIPEGFTVAQIATAFQGKMTNFNSDRFLLEAKEKEGYLFPDTYFFTRRDTDIEVLEYMSDNFEKKITPIRSEIVSSGKTEKEIIIMASIIEKEAKGSTDRAFISGILWKRISIGMPLQADAAPITYKEKGLPDNPISNPGLESIKASIYPQSSPYLYYLHDIDGVIHFARNFEEHKANKIKYLK